MPQPRCKPTAPTDQAQTDEIIDLMIDAMAELHTLENQAAALRERLGAMSADLFKGPPPSSKCAVNDTKRSV